MDKLLKDETVQNVKEVLNGLNTEVRLIFFESDGCQTCSLNRQLYTELAQLNSFLRLEIFDIDDEYAEYFNVDVAPTLVVTDPDLKHKILFTGTPHGYEFTSLLDAILVISGTGTQLSKQIVDKVEAISRDILIQVFVSPTCPYCPIALKGAFPLAASATNVTVQMIQATEFPLWAQRKRVVGVPKLVINDVLEIEGAVQTSRLVEELSKL